MWSWHRVEPVLRLSAVPSYRPLARRPASGHLPGAPGGAPREPGTKSGCSARGLSSAALSLSLCFLYFFLDLPRDELPWGLLGWAQSFSRGRLRHAVGAEVATSPRSQSRPLWPKSLLTSAKGSCALGGSSRGGRWASVPVSGPGVGSRASWAWGTLNFPLRAG